MTRKELIDRLAKCADLSQAEAARALECVEKAIMHGVQDEGRVVTNAGIFSLSERAARDGRNPATGETIRIAASRSARFKPSKGFKDLLNG